MFKDRSTFLRRGPQSRVDNDRALVSLILLEACIFVADIAVENDDVSFGFLYIFPMILTFYFDNLRHQMIIGGISIIFIAIGSVIPIPEADKALVVFANRLIAIGVVVICLSLARYRLLFIESLQQIIAEEKAKAKAQQAFVVTVSHEFRTPLTSIDGHAQQLLNSGPGQSFESIARRAHKIRGAVSRILVLVESIMHADRLEQAALRFNPVRYDLREVVHEVCHRQAEVSPEALIQLSQPDDPLPVNGDPILIDLALGNLLANAVKFSSKPARVAVTVAPYSGRFEVAVRDEGAGIPKADKEHLFERYFRAGNALRTPGSGIGLHLARELIRRHGGDIKAESVEGQGSTFTITLPGGSS